MASGLFSGWLGEFVVCTPLQRPFHVGCCCRSRRKLDGRAGYGSGTDDVASVKRKGVVPVLVAEVFAARCKHIEGV